MALSTADQAILRSVHHSWQGNSPLTINAVPLEVLATAEINEPDVITYPKADITVDAVSSGWLTYGNVGRMVTIGTAPGLADVTYGIIRKASTATTLYLSPLQQGEGGYARSIALDLDDNYYVTVYKFRPAWGIGSSIRKGKFYKNWNEAYSDQGKNPRAVVRLGEHQQADVDISTNLARFTINVDVYDFPGRSYQSHSWGVDGQTTISSSAAQLVVDCEPGCHEITYTRTDTKGKTTTAYRYLFANHPTLYPPLNKQFAMSVDMQQDRKGLRATLTFEGAFQGGELYPVQLFVMTERPTWGNPQTGVVYTPDDLDYPDSICDNFAGYALENTITSARGQRTTTLTIEAPLVCADHIRIEKQYIEERTNPKNWAQVTKILSNPVGVFYYCAAHHAPWLIDGHDFYFETYITNLRRKTHDLNKSETLGGQLTQLADRLDGQGNIGSRANGTTYMVRNSQYFPAVTRSAQITHWQWQPGDIAGSIEATNRYRPQVGKVYVGAWAYGGDSNIQAFRSLAPGPVASHAGGEAQLEDTTVVLAAGQSRDNELSGMHLAVLNNATTYGQVNVNGNLDIIEPCNLDDWHAWGIGAEYDPLGVGWTGRRILPLSVTRRWSGPGTNRKTITAEFEAETFGYPGITVPINTGGANNWLTNNAPPAYFYDYRPQTPDLGVDITLMLAWNGVLDAAKSDNFGDKFTTWTKLVNQTLDVTLDWHSAYFSDPADPVTALFLTWEEYPVSNGRLSLYSLELTPLGGAFEITGTPTLVTQWVNINPNDTFLHHARIIVSKEEADYWVMAYKDASRVVIDRSTDAGSNWAGVATVGDDSEDIASYATPLGIAVYDERLVIVAKDGSQNDDDEYIYFVYTASGKSGSITKVTNPTDWEVVPGCLALTNATAAIAGLRKLGAPEPDNALTTVDFDSGYPDYTVSGGQTTSGEATHATFPAQNTMAYGATSEAGAGGFVTCTVTVDLTALYTFESVTFWTEHIEGTTVNQPRSDVSVYLLDASGATLAQYVLPVEGVFAEGEYTITAANLNLTGYEQVSQVRVNVSHQYNHLSGTGVHYVFIDDIDIDATLIEYASERSLHTLNPSTGAYTARESYQKVGFNTYGIAVASDSSSELTAIVCDENGDNTTLLTSTNGGATWVQRRRVPGIVGAKRGADDATILFGYNRLELSNDAGRTSYDMSGDWTARIGALAQVRGVTGIL